MFSKAIGEKILNGYLQDCGSYMAGKYKGFFMVISNKGNQQYHVQIHATAPDEVRRDGIRRLVSDQSRLIKKFVNGIVDEHVISFDIVIPGLLKKAPDLINSSVNPIIDYLGMQGFTSGCERCGNTQTELGLFQINDGYDYLCKDCFDGTVGVLKEGQQMKQSQKSMLIPGIVGAFLGAILGCIVWILIFELGYIAGIAGACIGLCAMKGYELLGKHLDRKGVIVSVVVMVIMIYFVNRVSFAIDFYIVAKDYGWTFSDVYRSLNELLHADSDYFGAYVIDLVIGYLLTLISSIGMIIRAFRSSAGSYSIRRVQ